MEQPQPSLLKGRCIGAARRIGGAHAQSLAHSIAEASMIDDSFGTPAISFM
jgi:hypothetical protein